VTNSRQFGSGGGGSRRLTTS